MRTMYDGINSDATAIRAQFPGAAMVAGYADGLYQWSPVQWGLFPAAAHAVIVVSAAHNYGDVLDVEPGNATPGETEGWIRMRKAAGLARPTIYCSRDTIPAVRVGTGPYVLGRDYDIWAADYTGQPHVVESSISGGVTAACAATQYEAAGRWDVSAVYDDSWPRRCG